MKPPRKNIVKKNLKHVISYPNPGSKDTLGSDIRARSGNSQESYESLKETNRDALEDEEKDLSKDVAKFIKSLENATAKGISFKDEDAGHIKSSRTHNSKAVTKANKRNQHTDKNKLDLGLSGIPAGEHNRRGENKFIISPSSKWYLSAPALTTTPSLPTASTEFLSSKTTLAASLLEKDISTYISSSSGTTSSSDARFLTRVLASGTLSDRLSALTLMVQGSPVHNVRALESLRAMASKKGREESLKALRAIMDWWIGGGSPDRKLRYFRDQPLTHPDITDQHLLLWYFEDWLKKYFFGILQLLEALSVDPLPYVRTQAMNLIFHLLRDKPEQEQNLLRLLTNKLNDSEKSIASKASRYVLQVLQLHPQMKAIVIHEISAFILQPLAASSSKQQPPEGNTHARYYAVITFNQILLTPDDKNVAARLVDIYFELFKVLLGEDTPELEQSHAQSQSGLSRGKRKTVQDRRRGDKGATNPGFQEVSDTNSKLVSAILTGINRALPYAHMESSGTFDKHVDTLFRITHTATFSVSLQALMLILHVSKNRPPILKRFYRTLYALLIDARLATSSKQAMFLNLLFKAVKADHDHARIAAIIKRFIQVLGMHRPEFVCGGLYLLGEMAGKLPDVRNMTDINQQEATYDHHKRDPEYAHAESSCLWDLLPLRHHYHPSVALHAHQILTHAPVTATADLGINTLSHFLDRFVYRNAKKPLAKGASAMQPVAQPDGAGMVRTGKAAAAIDVVNPQNLGERGEENVPVDQVFFHKFFSRKQEQVKARTGKADRRKRKQKNIDVDDDIAGKDDINEGSDSDPEEAEIWNVMQKSVPELGESDVDDDGSDGGPLTDTQSHSSGDSGLALIEDEDDVVSDGNDPVGLIAYSSDEESSGDEEWDGFGHHEKTRKRGREEANGGKKKRRKLATFASYEDYAAMIENSKEDDI